MISKGNNLTENEETLYRNMKKILTSILVAMPIVAFAGIPDSVYVKPVGNDKGVGAFIEWSNDAKVWSKSIRGYVETSDYGPWDGGKKLYNPSMAVGANGQIALVFQVGDVDNQFGVTYTTDLIHWRPQDYPYMEGVGQCLSPMISYKNGTYEVVFHNKDNVYYTTSTTDLVHFTSPAKVAETSSDGIIRLPYSLIERLDEHQQAAFAKFRNMRELAQDDSVRFADLKEVKAEVIVDASKPKPISDMLMGVFFEDINYAADGGLCAELLQNGDFEYDPKEADDEGEDWNITTAWEVRGNLALDTLQQGISENNPHAVSIKAGAQIGASIRNCGWDGIPVRKGEKYDLSMYLKGGKVKVSLMDNDKALASTILSGANAWKKVKAVLRPTFDCDSAVLDIQPLAMNEVAIDMVSLMPRETYKGHGLRKDLAETIEGLHPKFMRFPGGCLAHGNGMDNIYRWKETIGPIEDRKPLYNLWHYHQSRRIGYYEFFQMCEDMGMEPLPVVAAGVPCQNSSIGGNGQQGGISMEEMGSYIQDILDLIEWANGDASTVWGHKRIEQGHKAPFNLKMIGIGNEDLVSPTFTERYLMICRAIKEKYPEIEICGTAGPYVSGSDYDAGWRLAVDNKHLIDMVDEHYYLPPGWYIYNQNFYDMYDRSGPKVYLGEWAAHGPGRKSTIETSLAEALYFCDIERNADIVKMTSYAPLLAREGHTQWNPDMIYFNGTEVKPTVNYYAHKMCGNSQGDEYLESRISTEERRPGVNERLATSTVRDSKSGKTYLKIVNILPVEVDAHLVLKDLSLGEKECKATVLTGRYDSTTARPQETKIRISDDCKVVLPAYSFTLVELN